MAYDVCVLDDASAALTGMNVVDALVCSHR